MTLGAKAPDAPDALEQNRVVRATRAWRVALSFSLAVHTLLVAGFLAGYTESENLQETSERIFELWLEPPLKPALEQEQTAAVEPPLPEAEIADPDPEPEPEPEQKPAVALRPLTVEAAPANSGRLNLERPEGWEALAIDPSQETSGLVFKRSSSAAIIQRRQEQETARALTRSQVARLGLPEEQFRRRTDAGEEVKTAKGCFIKRIEHGPSGMQERWWRTACKDSRKRPWQREVLSFGPDHRLEKPPANGKSDCPNGRCWAY